MIIYLSCENINVCTICFLLIQLELAFRKEFGDTANSSSEQVNVARFLIVMSLVVFVPNDIFISLILAEHVFKDLQTHPHLGRGTDILDSVAFPCAWL